MLNYFHLIIFLLLEILYIHVNGLTHIDILSIILDNGPVYSTTAV